MSAATPFALLLSLLLLGIVFAIVVLVAYLVINGSTQDAAEGFVEHSPTVPPWERES
jgi:hypothetical protein